MPEVRRVKRESPPQVWLEGLTLHVRDVEVSREFYMRMPGFVLQHHRPGQFALFRVGDSLLGLLGIGAPGFHIEIATSDLDELYAQLLARGLPVKGAPRQRGWGERTLTLVDPDGNQLEFQQRPPSTGSSRRDLGTIGAAAGRLTMGALWRLCPTTSW